MKKHKRGNVLLSKQEDKVLCTAIKNYCTLSNDEPMKKCIDEALNFFTNSPIHIKYFHEVLSNPRGNQIKFCMDNYISEPQVYLYRREIIWRIAIVCYAYGIFTL